MSTNLVEGNFEQIILDLLERIKRLEGASVSATELSEISSDLGLFEAGEIRVHADWNDPREPGDGFSGVRIIGEGVPIGDDTYCIIGYNNDSSMFAISNTTGKAFFCGGLAYIDADGITGNQLLKWMMRQIATSNGAERTMKFGMDVPEGSTTPAAVWSYTSPAGDELVVNGGAETGDFTGWTKTDVNGIWSIDSSFPQSGVKRFKYTGGSNDKDDYLYQRIVIDATKQYLISSSARREGIGSLTVSAVWYNAPAGGSAIGSKTLIFLGTPSGSWVNNSLALSPPTTAQSVEIIISMSNNPAGGNLGYVDSFSLSEITVNQKLWLADNGLNASNGLYPKRWGWHASEIRTSVTMTWTDTAILGGGSYGPSAANANDGDEYTVSCVLAAGIYRLTTIGVIASTCGLMDIYLDGALVISGIQWYASTTAYSVFRESGDITIANSGQHTFKFKVNGKHASAADFRILFQHLFIRQATD